MYYFLFFLVIIFLKKRGWLNDAPKCESEHSREYSDPIYKRKVYIGFNKKFTEDHLREYFSRFGVIEKIFFLRDGFGVSRGCAFILFKEESSVENIILKKPHFLANNSPIEVKYAFPKDFNNVQRGNECPDKVMYLSI